MWATLKNNIDVLWEKNHLTFFGSMNYWKKMRTGLTRDIITICRNEHIKEKNRILKRINELHNIDLTLENIREIIDPVTTK